MSKIKDRWFIGNSFIEKERDQLRILAVERERNMRLVKEGQATLKRDLIQGLSGISGLSLSFGAGCATVLAYKNREHLRYLKGLPWSQIVALLLEYGTLEQDPLREGTQADVNR